MNVLIFVVAFCIMAAVMTVLLPTVIARISSESAEQYALSSAEALSLHISREIDVISRVANSNAVKEWMADEHDEDKMQRALYEMASLIGELYSFNMYVVFADSLNEYRVGRNYETGGASFIDVAILDERVLDDSWYFDCVEADRDYLLDVGIDHVMQRKRVWLDYKVVKDGIPLGVISSGLEFSHMTGEIFSQYESSNMRGLVIDEYGYIHMDSYLMHNNEFLFNDYAISVDEVFSNPVILSAIDTHLDSIEGYIEEMGTSMVVELMSGPYRIMTITQIRSTSWSIVILSGGTSLLDTSNFLPILVTVLVLLCVVAIVTSAANYRLVFLPLGKLGRSLGSLRESPDGRVSGVERDDELGELSRTIQDLFTKANIDALTGIYNRRFMENNLEHIMGMLSRTQGILSVLMLDIDYFKKFNDTYGHERGDVCLKAVAQEMPKSVMRASDFVARYGGEEFIAILPNTDETGARMVAENLLENVRALKIPHSGSTVAPFVTVSVGVTTGEVAYGVMWEEFVRRADDALYESKQNGRNQYTFKEM